MELKAKRFIKMAVLIFCVMFAFVEIKDLFKYTMTSIPKNHIAMIEVITEENLKEMEKTGKIVYKNRTSIAKNPKQFIEHVKKDFFTIEIDSKKYYINIFVHYYIAKLKNMLTYLIILVLIVLIIKKDRIKEIIKRGKWRPILSFWK